MFKKLFFSLVIILALSVNAKAQMFNNFSLFGGPMVGWQMPSVSDLNYEIKKLGIEEFPSSGFLTIGGGGYLDVPVVKGLRVGAFGTGFSQDRQSSFYYLSNPVIRTVKFSFSYAALSVEYTNRLSEKLDYTMGGNIGLGSTRLSISNFNPNSNFWNTSNDSSFSSNHTSNYSSGTYSFNPQIGLGFYATKFMYFKLNAGYMFTVQKDWKLEEILVVKNVPTGIKADGFNFNLGINFGLFVK